jgi:hypothetical protein
MKIDSLISKLNTEFNFSEIYESLENDTVFKVGSTLLIPNYREKQRPWISKAYNEWVKGDRTIVLIAPVKVGCKYFKKYLTDVAEVRTLREPLHMNCNKIMIPMIIAVYWKRSVEPINFQVSFN